MKTTNMPITESAHLISFSRTEDILVGPLADFYFDVLYAGHYVCKSTFSIRRSGMNSIFLLLTTSGEGALVYQEKSYRLTPGCVMLIDTKILHEYHAVGDRWSFKYIHFQGGMSERYYAYTFEQLGPVFELPENMAKETEHYLDAILSETEKTVNIDYAVVSSYIYTILTRFLSHDNPNVNSEKSSTGLEQALTFITRNYHAKISTGSIAAASYLSRSYLSELFKKTYGIGPHEYLTMYRLSQAKKQLQNTNCSVAQIAEQTGFRDVFTLSRVFKKKFGITPSEYRKQVQNSNRES